MQIAHPAACPRPEAPKYDHKLTLRLDAASLDKLKRLADGEFLDPAIYARQVLLKHLATRAGDVAA